MAQVKCNVVVNDVLEFMNDWEVGHELVYNSVVTAQFDSEDFFKEVKDFDHILTKKYFVENDGTIHKERVETHEHVYNSFVGHIKYIYEMFEKYPTYTDFYKSFENSQCDYDDMQWNLDEYKKYDEIRKQAPKYQDIQFRLVM